MKCKANKNRPVSALRDLGLEANLFFMFYGSGQVQICSVRLAHRFGLLRGSSLNDVLFDETWVAPVNMTVNDFRQICVQKDVAKLVEVSETGCARRETSMVLREGCAASVATTNGKRGLFFVKKLNRTSVQIDACHILL